ncbi:MAG: GyrI-like domain-containing protein [Pseudomonadota bacterium]
MRAHVVAIAFLFLVVGCKGDEKKSEAVDPAVGSSTGGNRGVDAPPTIGESGPEAPPTNRGVAPKGHKSRKSGASSAQLDFNAPPTVGAEPDPAAIVDRAIAAAGGREALAGKFAAYTVESKGLYLGVPYEMTSVWRAPDQMYMGMHSGEMQMGYVGAACWNVMNGVVLDCFPEEAKMVPTQLYLARLEGLYPLKDPAFRFTSLGPGEVNGKVTAGLQVDHPDAPVSVRMEFYDDTGLLARSEYPGSFGGTPGPVVHDILTYREVDGVQVPLKSIVTAGGKRFVEDRMTRISWEADDALFARPEQRPLGAPSVRVVGPQTVAFVLHKGPYEDLGAALSGVMGWVASSGLDVMGPPTFVYLNDPGQVQDPAAYLTEIRVPVTATRDVTVQHEVYQIKRVEETTVAARLEKGAYDTAAAAIGLLAAWCGENGYVIAGPPMMTGYSDPTRTPPEELLSELLFPVRKPE